MKNTMLAIASIMLGPSWVLAQNGVVLINQATVAAAPGANRSTAGFPYQITQPGSYQLSGNLVVAADTDAIDILSGNVTLDLNGFTISGPVTCTGAGSTITCAPHSVKSGVTSIGDGVNNITVRNGSVVGFGYGVKLQTGQDYQVEEIHASGNYSAGITVESGLVRRNTVGLNGFGGIITFHSTVTENVANGNFGYGLAAQGGVFGSNTLTNNGTGPQVFILGAVSQNNNACNGIVC